MRFSLVISLLLVVFCACRTHKVRTVNEVPVVSRTEWGAKAPVLPMKQHVPNRITVHHTATKQSVKSLEDKLKGLQNFSQSRSQLGNGRMKELWADIPYHFYITAKGEIGEGRELQYIGDSNTPYDPTGHALIVLEGNFEVEPVTDAQLQSLQKLILSLSKKYGITSEKISGHKDNADTLCPGKNLYELIPNLKQFLEKAS